MANQSQGNGRNVALPEEKRPSWRPQDDARRRNLSEEDDRYETRHARRYWEDREEREPWRAEGQRYAEGRGRYGRDQSYGANVEDRGRERDWEDRGYNPERYGAQGGYGGGAGWEAERIGTPRGYGYEMDRALGRSYGGYGAEGRGYDRSYENRGYGNYGEARAYGESMRSEGLGERDRGRERERRESRGEEARGFRGRGPQGYRRSDERLRELVCDALTEDDRVDASHIEVRVENAEVTLTGTVDDRQQKRCAEDAVEQIGGVRDVHNQLRVPQRT